MNPGSIARTRVVWLVGGVALGVLASAVTILLTAPAEESGEAGMPEGMSMEAGPQTVGQGMPGMDMPMTDGAVRLTPEQIRQFGVVFATVEERALEARVRTVGVVAPDETRLVDVTTKFPGYVDRLYADFTGSRVNVGSPLLDVYSPELVAAQEEVLLARDLQATVGTVVLPGARPVIDLAATARRRLDLWDITEDQIETLLDEGAPRRTLSVRAPITGVVLEKSVVAGSAFEAGQILFRLADLSSVWIDVEIRENDAELVGTGAGAVAAFAAYPGEAFRGTIDFVHPTVDARTRSVRARVVLPNGAGRLRPGMFATVTVTARRGTGVTVPSDAVVWTGESAVLFVEDPDGGIRPVDVQVGATVGDHTVVLSGVSIGQRVVGSAQYLIDAEANIGAIMRSMMGMIGAGDMADMDMR